MLRCPEPHPSEGRGAVYTVAQKASSQRQRSRSRRCGIWATRSCWPTLSSRSDSSAASSGSATSSSGRFMLAAVWLRRFGPETALADHLAVVAAARRPVNVVPVVLATHRFAIFALVSHAEVDQPPGQVTSQPRPPPVRMMSMHRTVPLFRLANGLGLTRDGRPPSSRITPVGARPPTGPAPVRPRVTASLEAGFRDQREEPFAPPRCDAEIPGDARADTQTNPRPTQIRSGCPRGDRVA
jgi:hypothetical protein